MFDKRFAILPNSLISAEAVFVPNPGTPFTEGERMSA
jgi:hypothetical protein